MKPLFKAKLQALIVDLLCWAYLGYLVLSSEYTYAAIWTVSVLILNIGFFVMRQRGRQFKIKG